MKITEQRQDVVVGGAQSVDAFTIKASAKAFQILSSNLYSNPLGSMIRELSTNAYDAHIMVDKKDEPFLVTLPNSLEPTFKIRDFGPGLSNTEIMNVYTTFFESTKTDSNDVVGCLGLGSKSPFGVADSFTVTSFYDGKKTIYSAFLNDARIPSIAKFLEEDTDEENGIEIEVAIKEDDFYTFNREVNSQLKYFKVKPTIQGSSDFKWNPDEEYMYEGTDWKMVKGGDRPRVIQGQIQYPISTDDMGKAYDNATEAVKSILNRGVLFEVPIGDVNIAPSREALSYDDSTSANIIKAAEKILEELPPQIKAAIQDSETEYEAKLRYSEIMSDLGVGYYGYGSGGLAKAVDASGEILWKGKDVSSRSIEVAGPDIKSSIGFSKSYNNRFQKSNHSAQGDWQADMKDKKWEYEVRDLKHTVWVFATESDKAVEGRSKQFVNEEDIRDVRLNIIRVSPGMTARKLANRLGLKVSNLTIAADLPKVKRVGGGAKNSNGKKEFTVQKMSNRYSYNKTDQWNDITVENDLTELEGFYVKLDRYDVIGNDDRYVNDLKNHVAAMKELKLIDEDAVIYGLRKANQKRKHNLVNLFDHVDANIGNLSLNSKYDFGEDSNVVDKLKSNMSEVRTIHEDSVFDDESPIKIIIDAIIQNESNEYSHDVRRFISKFGKTVDGVIIDLRKEAKDLDEQYPMIRYTGYYLDAKVVTDYILQMDMIRNMVHNAD